MSARERMRVIDAFSDWSWSQHFRTVRYLVDDELTAPDGYKRGDMVERLEPIPFGKEPR